MIAKVNRAGPDNIQVPQRPAPRQGISASPALMLVLWRRRWVVLVTVLACVSAAVVYLVRATPIYTSTARLLVEQSGPRILSDNPAGADRSASYAYAQAQVLTSTPIVAA